jgi:DNA-binding NarL/FixJ family response regulator
VNACTGCRRVRPHHALGQCSTCYHQPYHPRTGNPGGAGIPKTGADIAGRVENLAELLRQETDRTVIARRLGVSVRTVSRYLDRLERSA